MARPELNSPTCKPGQRWKGWQGSSAVGPPPRSQAGREGAGLVPTSPSEAPAPPSSQPCGLVSDREALQHRQVALWCFNTGFNASLSPQNPQVRSSRRSCLSKEDYAGRRSCAGWWRSERDKWQRGWVQRNRQLRKCKSWMKVEQGTGEIQRWMEKGLLKLSLDFEITDIEIDTVGYWKQHQRGWRWAESPKCSGVKIVLGEV